jgi:hypothetical protein
MEEVSMGEDQDDEEVDRVSLGEAIRNSRDIPKIRSRIFEESLESQEISFYIGWDPLKRKLQLTAFSRCEEINWLG